ncbi:MAG TPA: hypothetical protein VKA73_00985 [Rubrobacter sp.]|nr:hypothetical protein [Rubrobacter sp.]
MGDELHAGHREGRGDAEAGRFWEDHYRRRGRVWSGRPNPVLVDVVGSLRPGTALDLGCGEWGAAIWLARLDWRVTSGGLLLIVDHASVRPGSWDYPEETLAPLDLSPDEWRAETLEAREREATGPNGRRTLTDNVTAVRRLAPRPTRHRSNEHKTYRCDRG